MEILVSHSIGQIALFVAEFCGQLRESSILPNISLTCDVRIISETALVYPELTGPDMKLIRNPRPSRPMPISMMPVNRASSTAFCQTPPAAWN